MEKEKKGEELEYHDKKGNQNGEMKVRKSKGLKEEKKRWASKRIARIYVFVLSLIVSNYFRSLLFSGFFENKKTTTTEFKNKKGILAHLSRKLVFLCIKKYRAPRMKLRIKQITLITAIAVVTE